MVEQWIADPRTWIVLVFIVLAFVVAAGLGNLTGRLTRSAPEGDPRLGALESAMLGLLALLMAFAFSMAANRNESRRQLLVSEANAIGTTYLRAKMLPEPHRSQIAEFLREYTDLRVPGDYTSLPDEQVSQIDARSQQIQDQLWLQAVAVTEADPSPVPSGIFVQSLNDMIDLHATRMAIYRQKLALTIIDLLFLVSIITMGMVGYVSGAVRRRSLLPTIALMVVVALVLTAILDLDQAGPPQFQVSSQVLVDLRNSMR